MVLGRNSRLDELQAAILLVKLKYLDRWNQRRREIATQYTRLLDSHLTGPAARVSHGFAPSTTRDDSHPNHNLFVTRYSGAQHGNPRSRHPLVKENEGSVHHLFVIRTDKRDQLKAYLEKKGIGTGIHYPIPIHLVASYRYLGYKEGDFPESERASREVLSLPMYPELRDDEIEIVSKAIVEFLR